MSALLTPEEVARLKALEQKARGDLPLRVEASKAYPGYLLVCDGGADEDDAALFEALRNAAPSLIATAELSPVLVEALEFYADPKNWRWRLIPSKVEAIEETDISSRPFAPSEGYGGKRARAALEAYRQALREAAAK